MSGLQEVPKSKFSRSLNEPIASNCSLQSFTNKVEINHFIGGPCQEEELPLGIRHAALKSATIFVVYSYFRTSNGSLMRQVEFTPRQGCAVLCWVEEVVDGQPHGRSGSYHCNIAMPWALHAWLANNLYYHTI